MRLSQYFWTGNHKTLCGRRMSEGAPRSKENLRRFMCLSDVANTATVVPVGQVGGVDAVDPSRMSFSVNKNDFFKDMIWTSMVRFDKIDSERRLLQAHPRRWFVIERRQLRLPQCG